MKMKPPPSTVTFLRLVSPTVFTYQRPRHVPAPGVDRNRIGAVSGAIACKVPDAASESPTTTTAALSNVTVSPGAMFSVPKPETPMGASTRHVTPGARGSVAVTPMILPPCIRRVSRALPLHAFPG